MDHSFLSFKKTLQLSSLIVLSFFCFPQEGAAMKMEEGIDWDENTCIPQHVNTRPSEEQNKHKDEMENASPHNFSGFKITSEIPQYSAIIPDDILSSIFEYLPPRYILPLSRELRDLTCARVTRLYFPKNASEDEFLSILQIFPNSTSLDFGGNSMFAAGCSVIRLWGGARQIAAFPRNFAQNIVSLHFGSHDRNFNLLQQFPNLTCLSLGRAERNPVHKLFECTNLKELDFGGLTPHRAYAPKDAELARLTNLTRLNLGQGVNEKITDAVLLQLTNLTDLNLGLNNSTITDVSLSLLTDLTSLSLGGNYNITNFGLFHLTNLTSLDLGWRNTEIRAPGLLKLTNLASLNLGTAKEDSIDYDWGDSYDSEDSEYTEEEKQPPKKDIAISDLLLLTNLRDLTLSWGNNNIRDEDLLQLTNLTSLDVKKRSIFTDASLSLLTNLTSLHIGGNKNVTITCLFHLSNLNQLNDYDLKTESVGLNSFTPIAVLLRLTNLTSLDLGEDWDLTISDLLQLTNLKSLNLGEGKNTNIDNISLTSLLLLTNLTRLDLAENREIRDAGLRGLTNLRELNLGGNQKITDAGLFLLTNLTSLKLGWNYKIKDRGLFLLTNLTRLDLGCNQTTITDNALLRLTNLTYLKLGRNVQITNSALKKLTKLIDCSQY